jgi:hypothetical protein
MSTRSPARACGWDSPKHEKRSTLCRSASPRRIPDAGGKSREFRLLTAGWWCWRRLHCVNRSFPWPAQRPECSERRRPSGPLIVLVTIVRASHPVPTFAVTLLTLLLAHCLRLSPRAGGTIVVVAVFFNQIAIGLSNDIIDVATRSTSWTDR